MADVIITFIDEEKNRSHDLVVPDEMTADEFISALRQAYRLEGRSLESQRFMRMEEPIGLLKGTCPLSELGMRNGSIVYSGKKG